MTQGMPAPSRLSPPPTLPTPLAIREWQPLPTPPSLPAPADRTLVPLPELVEMDGGEACPVRNLGFFHSHTSF